MRLETIRKEYNDGLLLRGEALQVIEAIGKSRDFAERFLDGYDASDIRGFVGASRQSLLVIRD